MNAANARGGTWAPGRRDGVPIIQGPEAHENGRFACLLDPDSNKLELWQPMLWDEKNKQP